MIRYRAIKRAWPYAVICFLLLASACGAAYAAHVFGIRVLYVLSFALLMFQFQIFALYILSAYEYELCGSLFRIYRVAGKLRKCIFDLDLCGALSVTPYPEFKKNAEKKKYKRFSCMCGVPKKRGYALVYGKDGSVVLFFAPDGSFASALSAQLPQR